MQVQYRSVKGFTGWGQLGILFAFTGLGFILAGLVQLGIGLYLIPAHVPDGQKGDEILKAMLRPENVGYARLVQVLGTFFLMFIPPLLFLLVCHGRNWFWLGFNRHINYQQILIGFLLIFFANVIAGPLADLSKNVLSHFPAWDAMARKLEEGYSDQVASLSNLKSWGEFFVAIFIMAFFPALFEELFFRGTIQNLLERWWKMPVLALVVTSVFFSFFHMSVYLFLSRLVLGIVLGLMYQRSKNIWVNIVAHFLNNSIALIQLFWFTRHGQKIDADKLDPQMPAWVGLVGAGITIALFIAFEKLSAKNRRQIAFEEMNLLEKADSIHSIAQS